MTTGEMHAGWTVKDEIRAKKKARKVAARDGATPEPEPILTTPSPLAPALEPTTPEPTPDRPPGPGRTWACRVCRTAVRSNQIPGGWLSIARWPEDRVRHGPITSTFCSPKCTGMYLGRLGQQPKASVQYPVRKGATR
jgi:hypothetical protein